MIFALFYSIWIFQVTPKTAESQTSSSMLVVQIARPATLPCLVSDPSTARWMFTPPGSADGTNKDIVSNGKTMMRNFVDFLIISEQVHQYDLHIRRVRFTDAGSYYCKDESNMAMIELVVLGRNSQIDMLIYLGEIYEQIFFYMIMLWHLAW